LFLYYLKTVGAKDGMDLSFISRLEICGRKRNNLVHSILNDELKEEEIKKQFLLKYNF
jgi:hypothetical protein